MPAQPTAEQIQNFASALDRNNLDMSVPAPEGSLGFVPPPQTEPSPEQIAHFAAKLKELGTRGGSTIAPVQTQASGPMVPVVNYLGQTIGMKPANPTPLFQNPFAAPSAPSASAPSVTPSARPNEPAGPPTSLAGSDGFTGDPNTSPAPPGNVGIHAGFVSGSPFSKTQKELQKEQQQGMDRLTQAEMGSNDVLAAKQMAIGQSIQDQAEAMRAKEDEKNAQWQAIMAKRQELSNAVESGKVDPDRLYGHADTGTKLGLILGGALGGAFQGWNKMQSNPFIDQVNLTIQRDIDAQKEALASKRNALSENTNLLGQMRGYFGDARMGELAATELMQKSYLQQLEGTVSQQKNPAIAANGALAITALKTQVANTEQQALQHAQVLAAQYAAGGPIDKARQEEFVATGPDGQGYLARDKEAATAGRALVQMKESFTDFAKDARVLRDRTSAIGRAGGNVSTIFQSPEYAALSSKQAQMLGTLKLAEQTKSITPELSKLAEESMGDWLSPGGHPDVRAQTFLKGLAEKIDAHRRSQGGQAAVDRPRLTPSGQIVYNPMGLTTQSSPRGAMPRPIAP